MDLVNEGFDAAVRIAYLADSNLVARRIAPISDKFVASRSSLIARGIPHTPNDLVLY